MSPLAEVDICIEGELTSIHDISDDTRTIIDALVASGKRRITWDVRHLRHVTTAGAAGLTELVADLHRRGITSAVWWHPNFEARRALAGLNAEFIDAVLR